MTSGPAKRGRGRPPKPGGALAALDRLLQEADPQILALYRELFGDGSKNDLVGDPVQAAETLSRDRAEILRLARPARSRKAPAAERERILARAERIAALPALIAERPGKTAAAIAQALQRKGLCKGVALDTLRKDIARLQKVGRFS